MSQLQSINVGVITTYLKLLLIDELVRRKGDLEYDVQVALLERTTIDGHAFMWYCFHRARFDDLTGWVPPTRDPRMANADERLTELELKYMEQSDLVEQLNRELVRVNETVTTLEGRVTRLERQIEDVLSLDKPANEKPPHY